MSDYQAIYDAVRSRLGNVGESIAEAARQAFDISWARDRAMQSIEAAAYEHGRPSAVFRPKLALDGNQWCALYGENLMEGVAGFGDTADAAMRDFDRQWTSQPAPKLATLAERSSKGGEL